MATAVETQLLLEGDQSWDIVGICGCGLGCESCIQVVDVSLMMLLMVQLHDLLGDDGLQGLLKVLVRTLCKMRKLLDVHRMRKEEEGEYVGP